MRGTRAHPEGELKYSSNAMKPTQRASCKSHDGELTKKSPPRGRAGNHPMVEFLCSDMRRSEDRPRGELKHTSEELKPTQRASWESHHGDLTKKSPPKERAGSNPMAEFLCSDMRRSETRPEGELTPVRRTGSPRSDLQVQTYTEETCAPPPLGGHACGLARRIEAHPRAS